MGHFKGFGVLTSDIYGIMSNGTAFCLWSDVWTYNKPIETYNICVMIVIMDVIFVLCLYRAIRECIQAITVSLLVHTLTKGRQFCQLIL
jgi:hypothetical protein